MVGNQSVMSSTHVKVVPAADITTARHITFGALDVRHLTTLTHKAVTTSAAISANQLNSGTKPGTFLATFLAHPAGMLVVIANHITQINVPSKVKVNKENQSMKLITVRLMIGRLKHAQITKGGMIKSKDCSLSA